MKKDDDGFFLESQRLYLREVRLSDVGERYYQWLNDRSITAYLESRFFPHSKEAIRDYVRERQVDRNNVFLAIVLKDGDRHVGNIKLGPIDWIHRRAEIGILIGEKDCWGKGVATEVIQLVVTYGFRTLNLQTMVAGAYEVNKGSVRAFEKAGFDIEGVQKKHFFYDGEYIDGVLLGIERGAWEAKAGTGNLVPADHKRDLRP